MRNHSFGVCCEAHYPSDHKQGPQTMAPTKGVLAWILTGLTIFTTPVDAKNLPIGNCVGDPVTLSHDTNITFSKHHGSPISAHGTGELLFQGLRPMMTPPACLLSVGRRGISISSSLAWTRWFTLPAEHWEAGAFGMLLEIRKCRRRAPSPPYHALQTSWISSQSTPVGTSGQ